MESFRSKVNFLPKDIGSLSRWLPAAEPDTLFALGTYGGMSVAPDANFTVRFGRNEEHVNICVGARDTYVSRRQGSITREYSRWVLSNTGRLPIRFPGGRLVLSGDQAELSAGYTPLFIVSPRQEHLLEVRVATSALSSGMWNAPEIHEESTRDEERKLSAEEKLVLVCLGQRYLRGDRQPQPLTWAQVAFELSELRPAERWTPKRAAHIVAKVRKRLSREHGIPVMDEDVPPPVGNALNHNLMMDLLVTSTIVKSDLIMLGE